ncbi:MAG: hypothetical protein HY244_08945 [Rhizobiales bacterium]|nr:hypothetical protein [Hyphomicrobiales bacterium]
MSLALGVALLATSLPAHAADDGASLDQKVFRGILEGLGLRKDGEAINYQERAPLVIPPGRTLPPPERADAALANNPAWPKDPDVIKRKRELEQERATGNKNSVDVEAQARVLRPDQLAPGGDSRKEGRRNQVGSNPTGWFGGERLTSSDLGYKGGLFSGMFGGSDEETAKFTNEPPRASLTAPPPGYQTPSPEQPYGLSGRTAAPKATNYSLEHGTHNN